MSRKHRIEAIQDCGDGRHRVVTTIGKGGERLHHRAEPCEECPWRTDSPIDAFPASAYRHSASTAYDMAQNVFACHMQGADKPATCAGFLLRGAAHNLTIRLAIANGRYDPAKVSDGGKPLYASYRAMAIANGVDPDDEVLAPCRGQDEEFRGHRARS